MVLQSRQDSASSQKIRYESQTSPLGGCGHLTATHVFICKQRTSSTIWELFWGVKNPQCRDEQSGVILSRQGYYSEERAVMVTNVKPWSFHISGSSLWGTSAALTIRWSRYLKNDPKVCAQSQGFLNFLKSWTLGWKHLLCRTTTANNYCRPDLSYFNITKQYLKFAIMYWEFIA